MSVIAERAKPTFAEIQILDGSPDSDNFQISKSNLFAPQNLISIRAGYDGNHEKIFEGKIDSHSVRADQESGPTLSIACQGPSSITQVGSNATAALQLSYGDDIDNMNLRLDSTKETSGLICFPGSAVATPGSWVKLANINQRFDGNYIIIRAHHRIQEGSWTTETTISSHQPVTPQTT